MDLLDDKVLVDILSRLSAKTLARLKRTSKRWCKLISEPSSIAMQAQISTQNVLGLLHVTAYPMSGRLMYLPIVDEDNGSDHLDTSLGFSPEFRDRISIVASCHGLLLCRNVDHLNRYSICNPTTKVHRLLPCPRIENFDTRFGLAVDLVNFGCDRYTVVCIDRKESELIDAFDAFKFTIFTSARRFWRSIDETLSCPSSPIPRRNSAVYYNGALHWLRKTGDIVTFHVETEHARLIELPEAIKNLSDGEHPGSWFGRTDGFINFVQVTGKMISIWVLEDYDNVRWRMKHRLRVGRLNRGSVPLFFDNRRIVLANVSSRGSNSRFQIYDVDMDTVKIVKAWETWMDSCRSFFPYVSNMIG